ncbi:flagellar hook-associated protein FlgK [Ruegeria sp.]|uniref:flagellar hook-associated protein FlgK n=1 Tax=Ruegeria sp. TaxID=1879320 RepID=UPI003B000362
MNLSTALNNAMSGLTATSRGASVVSGNIANALTPGYAKRSLELTTSLISGNGVRTAGIVRHQDPVLTANRRATDADLAHHSAKSDFHTRFEGFVGMPEDPTSISNRLAGFESSLITAASLPDSVERLDQVARSGRDLTASLNRASEGLRQLRSDADRTIGAQVASLNQTLKDIEDLNARIPAIRNSGGDINAFLDQRQVLIDQVNKLIPVNVVPRDNDRVSLYSDGGLILLEGKAAEFSFTTTGDIQPHMTVGNSLLSGLEMNGNPVRTSGDTAQIRGGALAAQFEIRDQLAPEVQTQLDTVARDS